MKTKSDCAYLVVPYLHQLMMAELSEFANKRVLVTGASKGIGFGCVVALLKAGAHVIAVSKSIDEVDLNSSLKDAHVDPSKVTVIQADLADAAKCAEAATKALPVDYLVNNAGVALNAPFLESKVEDFDTTMAVNLRAAFVISQVVAKDMVARGIKHGAIVNVSSQASMVALDLHTGYCTSKAALDQLTRMMALELGPHGIRTNSVNPTVVLTEMGTKAWSDPAKAGPMLSKIPLGKFAEVEDVVEAILFLLSPSKARMVNGVALPVDGGFLARG